MLRKCLNHYGENEYHPRSFKKIYKVLELNNKKCHSTSKKKIIFFVKNEMKIVNVKNL